MNKEPSLQTTLVDRNSCPPAGRPCASCGFPVELGDQFCVACGSVAPPIYDARGASTPPLVAWPEASSPADTSDGGASAAAAGAAANVRFLRCETCGSEVRTDPKRRSYVCPFCDSAVVAEYDPNESGRQEPEFVIGFAITHQQAQEKFQSWVADNAWFRPGDLKTSQIVQKMRGVYLPFWSFSMLAESSWRAHVGEYWTRVEHYTETDSKGQTVMKSRTVQETEWWPLAGKQHRYCYGYLVSGSRGLPQATAAQVMPFQLPGLKRFQPYFLAGWECEEYSVQRDTALDESQREYGRREQESIARFLPGDTHRELQVQTDFQHVRSDLCLLPFYVLSYQYRDKLFRFLVNGQTGKVWGEKPISWRRIGVAMLLVGLLFLLLAILFGLASAAGR